MFKDKHVALYVSGGIAAYKVANLARTFIKLGAEVRVGMTKSATKFITPYTFQILTKHHVYTDIFDEQNPDEVAHVELAQWADLSIVAPATANIIAKMANGIADDFVTTALLATPKDILVIPAMNDIMYNNLSMQDNLLTLRQRGIYLMEPEIGFLAEGYEGKGRFPDDEAIVDVVKEIIRENDTTLPLKSKHIIVTAGGTKEAVDPVRYLTNKSSGKMGHAIAEAAYARGADVTLITASSLDSSSGINRIDIDSAIDLHQAVHDEFEFTDALIMSAAVSDYRPATSSKQKIKKDASSTDELVLNLVENPDILKSLIPEKTHQTVVGFAAETEKLDEYAQKKLHSKKLDMLVGNDVSKSDRGFNADTNAVTMFFNTKPSITIDLKTKEEVAEDILDQLTILFEEKDD